MAEEIQQEVQAKETIKGKTVFSITLPTPMWATWVFRFVYWISFGFMIWITSTHIVPDANKAEIMLGAGIVERIIWGMARGIGIKKTDFEDATEKSI